MSGEHRDDTPPFGRSWGVLYAAVLVILALWIAAFTVFTRVFQ